MPIMLKRKKTRLFEFCELARTPDWYHRSLRQYLSLNYRLMGFHRMWKPFLETFVRRTKSPVLLDVGSGDGEILLRLVRELPEADRRDVILSDIFPDYAAIRRFSAEGNEHVLYYPGSINATSIPSFLPYPRVFVNSFHHFSHEDARRILGEALDEGQSVLILEYVRNSILAHMLFLVFGFLYCFLFFPFYKRKTVGMFLFTYLLPVIPIMTVWDGIVSNLRSYNREELEQALPERWRNRVSVQRLFRRPLFYPSGVTGFVVEPDPVHARTFSVPHKRLGARGARTPALGKAPISAWNIRFEEGENEKPLVEDQQSRVDIVLARRQGMRMPAMRIDGRRFGQQWINAYNALDLRVRDFVLVFDYMGENCEKGSQIDIGCRFTGPSTCRILRSRDSHLPIGRWISARIECRVRRTEGNRLVVNEKRFWNEQTFFETERDYGAMDLPDVRVRVAARSGLVFVSNLHVFPLVG